MSNITATVGRISAIVISICLFLCLTACGNNTETSQAAVKTTTGSDAESVVSAASDDIKEQKDISSSASGTDTDAKSRNPANTSNNASSVQAEKQSSPVSVTDNSKCDVSSAEDPDISMDFATYAAMSAEEQYDYYHRAFKNPDDFLEWYNSAKAEYEKDHKPIIIDKDIVIDLGK